MFGTPERRTSSSGETAYYIPLTTPKIMECQFELTKENTVVPNNVYQTKFQQVQRFILTELAKNRQLFRNPPTLESLEAITPNWGCILDNNTYIWNPYTHISTTKLKEGKNTGYVDFVLEGVSLSRSTIVPYFNTKYLEKPNELIEFEWSENVPELEEVSDLAAAPDGTLELRSPLVREREKKAAKEKIREALRHAEVVRNEAMKMANEFYHTYDVSDNESTFTEWVEDCEDTPV